MNDMLSGYLLTTGAVHRRDLAYVLAVQANQQDAEPPGCRVLVRHKGEWLPPVDVEWNARSCTVCTAPETRLLAMSEQGYVLALGGGKVVVEPRVVPGPQMIGPLTEIRSIDGHAYAVGTLRQVYLREGAGAWRAIDQTCRSSGPNAADFGFRDIDGFSSSDIYAAGWEGEIWHYNGQQWSPSEAPTNFALYSVRCAGDGYVYVTGQRGILLRGRHMQWEIIEHGLTEEDIWSCEWFDGRLYLATLHLLYVLEPGRKLALVDYGTTLPPATCYRLSAADGIMWSIGASDVMEFNGVEWALVV